MKIVYLDGQFIKVNPQIIEAFTPGVFKAKGVFETMLGLDGVVLDAALHIRRLRLGLKMLGIEAPLINPVFLKEVLRCNHFSSARVRLMVWRAGKKTHMLMAALPYKVPGPKVYRVCLIKTGHAAGDSLANVKSLDYALFAKSYARARAQGFDEALLLNRKGHIFEASRANIFWIKDRVLYTPPLSSGCLNGITRHQVMLQAKALKTAVKEEELTPSVLEKADAAFLTNSLIGLKPVEVSGIGNLSLD